MDIIGLVDWLETVVNSAQMYDKPALTFEDAARAAAELEGTRFSPLLTARLRDAQTAARLKLALETGAQDAYRWMCGDAHPSEPKR